MAKTAPAKDSVATTPDGKRPAGAHLDHREKHNSELTDKARRAPGGGAHSGKPDPTKDHTMS